jgi:hypothetical protein
MMKSMKRKTLARSCRWFAIAALALAPATALARQQEADRDVVDARLEGYEGNMTLAGGGTALTWVALVILGVIGCAGLFKDAKRTHLD